MKIRIVYAYKVIELELPMSDSGLSMQMKLEGCILHQKESSLFK